MLVKKIEEYGGTNDNINVGAYVFVDDMKNEGVHYRHDGCVWINSHCIISGLVEPYYGHSHVSRH